jgi:hypothetical protein
MPKPTNYTPPDAEEATPRSADALGVAADAAAAAAAAAAGGGVNDTITLYEYIRFTHFHAVEQAKGLAAQWDTLEGLVDEHRHKGVQARFAQQVRDATQMAHDIMVQYTRWSKQAAGAV